MEQINFIHKVSYLEHGSFYCEERGCSHEGICRCFKIEDVSIQPTNLNVIGESILEILEPITDPSMVRENSLKKLLFDYDHELLNRYSMDRILRINKLWEQENWYSEWESGFYGDEVNFISIKDEIILKIVEQFEQINNIWDLSEKIKTLLRLENGFLLKKLTDKTCSLIEVGYEDLFFGQQNHFCKVINENNEHYFDKNYSQNLPKGVCILEDNKWRVIDGYHRLSSTNKKSVKIFGFR